MSRLFISHSSANNAEAVAIREWLATEGWDDVFLDLDPERGIRAGERWEQALIGIGGHLAMPPLPHHRAYGSRTTAVRLG
jgi:hypothetical protein